MTSNSGRRSLQNYELDLLWGAWVELGVSGWQRTHADWAIDPEPLILATAAARDVDPRLRDEALDWCIHNWRYVSRIRLRNLLRRQTAEFAEVWGPFAATVSHHAGVAAWPGATETMQYKITGRSSLASLERPSCAWVRMRGMFGLGARTEILRYFLSGRSRASVASIANAIGYAKRNVADECDALATAGVLRTRQFANRFYYALSDKDALREFVGPIADVKPDWSALFAVSHEFTTLEQQAASVPHSVLMVEIRRVIDDIDDDLDRLGLDEPDISDPRTMWPAIEDYARKHMRSWGRGIWQTDPETRTSSLSARR